MNSKRILSLILAVVMSAAIMAGCAQQTVEPKESPSAPAETPDTTTETPEPAPSEAVEEVSKTGKGTLTFARTESIATLNPHMYTSDIESCCIEYTGAALYGYFYNEDKTGVSLRACLADGEPVKMNDDGTV